MEEANGCSGPPPWSAPHRHWESRELGPADAGVASGLINTTQQVGGAIGVAIATALTAHFVSAHAGSSALGGAALNHGFHGAFYVLAGIAAADTLFSALLLEPQPTEQTLALADEVLLGIKAAACAEPKRSR